MAKVSARSVLWCLVFCGFAVNYMIRINLNIAIVAMVKPRDPSVQNNSTSDKCYHHEHEAYDNRSFQNMSRSPSGEDSGFPWDENQQNLVLGAFFWIHWLTQLPGGLLAHKYGTKLVFGICNFAAVLCCFIIPMASRWHYTAVIVVRCIQGTFSGFTWPAMHSMAAKWIPPNERSKFVTAYLGSSVGAALTFPMCGYIIHWAGWPLVFYLSGALGTIWFIMWWLLVYDSPAEHPRISEKERDYILKEIGKSISKHKMKPPWSRILRSRQIWMVTLAQWGGLWGLFTMMTQAPTYLKQIHGWNIRSNGILSGVPHLTRMLFAGLFSQFGDYLLKTDRLSRTNVRKMATVVCCIGQGLCILALAYAGCNKLAAVLLIIGAMTMNGAVSTGPLAAVIDITPNYASVALGVSGTITCIPGFLSPAIVGWLTLNNQTVEQWRLIFFISAVQLLITGTIYVLFADSNIADWNDYGLSNKEKENIESEKDNFKEEKSHKIYEKEYHPLMIANSDKQNEEMQ